MVSTGDVINDGDDEDDNGNTGLNFIRLNLNAAINELELMAGPGVISISFRGRPCRKFRFWC